MRSLGGPRTAMLASLMMMGLMPISNAIPASDPVPRSNPPLTPEQIRAQAKRDRKAAKRKEPNND